MCKIVCNIVSNLTYPITLPPPSTSSQTILIISTFYTTTSNTPLLKPTTWISSSLQQSSPTYKTEPMLCLPTRFVHIPTFLAMKKLINLQNMALVIHPIQMAHFILLAHPTSYLLPTWWSIWNRQHYIEKNTPISRSHTSSTPFNLRSCKLWKQTLIGHENKLQWFGNHGNHIRDLVT